MKLNRLLGTSVLSLVLGATGLVYAQEQHEDAKPAQEEARPEAAKPSQDEMKAPRQDEAKPQKQEQDKAGRTEDNRAKQEDSKATRQEEQAGKPAEHAAGRGGRIPDDKFRANFGRQHTFVVNRPTVVGGQPHFQYGGYSFAIVDAWPVGWAYTDQCYIDYINGEYFLFDLLHPGVQIALVVL
jgi:hypothetical protein